MKRQSILNTPGGMVGTFTRSRAELQAVVIGEVWEGYLVTWAGPIHRSEFDKGWYERTIEGICAAACCIHCHQPLPDRAP
jgi:hypothetical protein